MKSPITTHVLNTTKGRPASGIKVELYKMNESNKWDKLGAGTTDADGRINDLISKETVISPGTYRMTFDVGSYFQTQNIDSFYTSIPIAFTINNPDQHFHIPLLLSPFGYSTYKGS